MPTFEEHKEEILGIIENRRDTYGKILVQSAILKQEGKWQNIITKFLPLFVGEEPAKLEKLDYGEFAIIESLISLDDFSKLISSLSKEEGTTITIDNYEIEFRPESLTDGHEYDSGTDHLNVGWFFQRFHFSSPPVRRIGPLVSPKLPLFPDSNYAIKKHIGVDLGQSTSYYGITICLPSYYARIREVRLGSTELSLTIEPKAAKIKDMIAKCHFERENETKQGDVTFSTANSGQISIGFRPERAHIVLVSMSKNEILDQRRFFSTWTLPKGVIIDIPELEIRRLIEQGETRTVEFKSRIDDVEEFVESVVAFANTEGGIILLGVRDDAYVCGLSEKDNKERVESIIRSHCIPYPKYECSERQLYDKKILLVRVEEGNDKPYTVRQRGPFVRAGSSDRIAERYELDEIYGQRTSTYPTY